MLWGLLTAVPIKEGYSLRYSKCRYLLALKSYNINRTLAGTLLNPCHACRQKTAPLLSAYYQDGNQGKGMKYICII